MTSKPALPVKPCTIRILDTNGDNVLMENNNPEPESKFNMETLGKQFGNHLTMPIEPMSRSRASSMNEDGDQKFEEELFNKCKQNESDLKATSGVLLHELEAVGIQREDPRLSNMIAMLSKMDPSGFGIDNVKLDQDQFNKLLKECNVLISKAFRGQLVISEFDQFIVDIKGIYDKCAPNMAGTPAQYIPQLARGDPAKWAVSLCTIDGQRFHIGDVNDKFSIQSTSKPFTYAINLDQLGADVVQKYIGREPSGRNFNEIVLDYNGQPHNPMINSGAIMSAALLLYLVRPEMSVSEKYEYVYDFFSRMAGREHVGFQNSTFLSERDTADRNHALAYFMRESGCFPNGPHNQGGGVDIKNILDFYIQTCSIEMTTASMAVLAGTLANGGICPITGERVLACDAVKNVLSLMYSCGMYNYSGQFAFQVGLPAKSGVSGIVILVIPNIVGFALYSPPLDGIGNSARGVQFAEELVKLYEFHAFDGIGGSISGKKNPRNLKVDQKTSFVEILNAASTGDKVTLERLYLSGVDMNTSDYDYRTALHLAVCENHVGCIKYLIETCKVELNPADRWGNTPTSEAKKLLRPRIVALLKKEQLKRGVFTPTLEDDEVSTEKQRSTVAINGTDPDTSDQLKQQRKPRGFASVVQSLVDDIIKPSNQEED